MIYFIQDKNGIIKIGSIKDFYLADYLAKIQEGNPYPLKVLLKVNRSPISLKEIYRRLSQDRVAPESNWFNPTKLVKDLIVKIHAIIKERQEKKGRKKWTDEMETILQEHYPTASPEWLTKELGLSWEQIKWKAWHLRIRRKKKRKPQKLFGMTS